MGSVCWVDRRAVIHHSAWFGTGSGFSGGTCPFWPGEVDGVIDSWIGFKGVVLVMLRYMLQLLVIGALDFFGTLVCLGGDVSGVPVLSNLTGLVQHFRSAFLDA